MPLPATSPLRPLDRLLLATLLPAFVIGLGLQLREGFANGIWYHRIVVAGAADGASYPVVERVDDAESLPGLARGDVLLQLGDLDLRGVTSRGTIARAHRASSDGPRAQVVAERAGRRFETRIERRPDPFWWGGLPFAAAMVAVGTLVLLRAPGWQAARLFFACASLAGIAWTTVAGRLLPETQGGALIWAILLPVAIGLSAGVS